VTNKTFLIPIVRIKYKLKYTQDEIDFLNKIAHSLSLFYYYKEWVDFEYEPKDEKEQLVGKTITIREPYSLYKSEDMEIRKNFEFTVYVEDEPYAYIGLSKYDDNGDKFATSFRQAKYFPKRFPMKHGCYRFTKSKEGLRIESVKYDPTKEYGNLNKVVYTFVPTEL